MPLIVVKDDKSEHLLSREFSVGGVLCFARLPSFPSPFPLLFFFF